MSHGTRASYSRGCRCQECRDAWAAYVRTRNHASGLQRPQSEVSLDREIDLADRLAISADEMDQKVPVGLTPLGLKILAAAQRRTRRRRGDVLDTLLRDYGSALTT